MARIKLLSTDFDGTLIGHPSDGRCVADFARELNNHRDRGGLWAVNTGRGLQHAIEGLVQFEPPFWPDFFLTNERDVFRRLPGGDWEAFDEWNGLCASRHEDLFQRAQEVLREIEHRAAESALGTMIYEEGIAAGMITTSEEAMESVVTWIEEAMPRVADFGYQRNTIYLRFCHRAYHKGAALAELCRVENVPFGEVLAAGDHFNDISMLDGTHAGMTACPSNAIDPVKETVRRTGGFVAQRPFADGVADAIAYFERETENISS